jgi:hypothetical protein
MYNKFKPKGGKNMATTDSDVQSKAAQAKRRAQTFLSCIQKGSVLPSAWKQILTDREVHHIVGDCEIFPAIMEAVFSLAHLTPLQVLHDLSAFLFHKAESEENALGGRIRPADKVAMVLVALNGANHIKRRRESEDEEYVKAVCEFLTRIFDDDIEFSTHAAEAEKQKQLLQAAVLRFLRSGEVGAGFRQHLVGTWLQDFLNERPYWTSTSMEFPIFAMKTICDRLLMDQPLPRRMRAFTLLLEHDSRVRAS